MLVFLIWAGISIPAFLYICGMTTQQKYESALISKFMGNGTPDPDRETMYHSSWDWLMPVVEKIGQVSGNGRFILPAAENEPLINTVYRRVLLHICVFTDVTDTIKRGSCAKEPRRISKGMMDSITTAEEQSEITPEMFDSLKQR